MKGFSLLDTFEGERGSKKEENPKPKLKVVEKVYSSKQLGEDFPSHDTLRRENTKKIDCD